MSFGGSERPRCSRGSSQPHTKRDTLAPVSGEVLFPMFCERSSRTSSSPVGKREMNDRASDFSREESGRVSVWKLLSESNHGPRTAIVVSETSKISCTPYLKLQGHRRSSRGINEGRHPKSRNREKKPRAEQSEGNKTHRPWPPSPARA